MQTYVHRPTEVEAMQVTGYEDETIDSIKEFIGSDNDIDLEAGNFILHTPGEGVRQVSTGDYIIKGVLGKVYPCSAEVFTESYDVKE